MAAPMKTCRFLFGVRNSGLFKGKGLLRRFSSCVPQCQEAAARWQLCSAVCLERPAVVTAPTTPLEEEYSQMLQTTELERSMLSNHELRHKDDLALVERRKADDYEDTEAEAVHVTALELEDGWEAELATFTPANRTTAADESGDKGTPQRCLDRKLTLLVEQKLGSQSHWVLPQGPRQEDETMRETAERVLQEKCGSEIKARFLGNAPVGFYKYKFASPGEDNTVGAKVFFFKAQLEGGNVAPGGEDINEVAWVTRDEMTSMVNPTYRQRVGKFIMEL